eukprot:8974131-Pyramimonas_sp.AAC.1
MRHACQARHVAPHAPAALGAPRSGHAQSVPGAPAYVGKHVGPHHTCQTPAHNRGGVAIMMS